MSVLLLSRGKGSEGGAPLVYSKRNITVCKAMQLLHWQYFAIVFGKALSTSSLPVALTVSNKAAKK